MLPLTAGAIVPSESGLVTTLLVATVPVPSSSPKRPSRPAPDVRGPLIAATMSVWLRANRPAFDLQNWCDCAGQRMTIRVIESRLPRLTASPLEPAVITQDLVEDEYDIAGR